MAELDLSEGIDLESDLDEPAMQRMCALGKARVFQPNEHLYRQGDPAGQVFVLLSGSVKATSTHTQGFDTLLKIHGPGSLLGLSALRSNGLRDANGIAIGKVQTTSFSSQSFLKVLKADSALGIILIRVLLKRQQELHGRIRAMLGSSVEQRLAEALLQLNAEATARSQGEPQPEIAITHEDLASLVISRRQYVTEIMRNFSQQGLIATGRGRVQIVVPDGLRRIVDE